MTGAAPGTERAQGLVVLAAPVIAALLLGLASIPHCMGMCGPLASSCSASRTSALTYLGTRGLAYTALGSLASLVAGPLRSRLPSGVLVWVLAVATAASLLFSARRLLRSNEAPLVAVASLARRPAPRPLLPVGLGLMTALLPCATLYGALAVAATAATPLVGALTMAAFATTSSAGLAISNAAARLLATDASGRGKRLVAGVMVVGAALVLFRPLAGRSDGEGPACHDDGTSALVPSPSTRGDASR